MDFLMLPSGGSSKDVPVEIFTYYVAYMSLSFFKVLF